MLVMKLSRFLLIAALVLTTSVPSFAQTVDEKDGESSTLGPRRQMATIIFAGLGGAVLGLSTLSFYGRPQDKLANIAIGAAVGIIVGVIYTAYQMASTPEEFYGPPPEEAFIHPVELRPEVALHKTDEVNVRLYEWSF